MRHFRYGARVTSEGFQALGGMLLEVRKSLDESELEKLEEYAPSRNTITVSGVHRLATGSDEEKAAWSKENVTWGMSMSSLAQLDLVAKRLLVQHPSLYQEYDRLESEAEFKLAICPPLACLVILLAIQTHWIWWGALLGVALLVYQAIQTRMQAGDVLVAALRARTVQLPFLEDLSSFLERSEETKSDQLISPDVRPAAETGRR